MKVYFTDALCIKKKNLTGKCVHMNIPEADCSSINSVTVDFDKLWPVDGAR